jgi:hypothetical protein
MTTCKKLEILRRQSHKGNVIEGAKMVRANVQSTDGGGKALFSCQSDAHN